MSRVQLESPKTTLSHGNLTGETFAGSLARLPVRLVDTFLAWQARASERIHLAALSEHHLKDIGMSRADVESETSKPFWQA